MLLEKTEIKANQELETLKTEQNKTNRKYSELLAEIRKLENYKKAPSQIIINTALEVAFLALLGKADTLIMEDIALTIDSSQIQMLVAINGLGIVVSFIMVPEICKNIKYLMQKPKIARKGLKGKIEEMYLEKSNVKDNLKELGEKIKNYEILLKNMDYIRATETMVVDNPNQKNPYDQMLEDYLNERIDYRSVHIDNDLKNSNAKVLTKNKEITR